MNTVRLPENAEEIGIELFDDTTYEPSCLMYWPSTSSDGEFVFHEMVGDLLTRMLFWQNTRTANPQRVVSKRQQSIVQRDIKRQTL